MKIIEDIDLKSNQEKHMLINLIFHNERLHKDSQKLGLCVMPLVGALLLGIALSIFNHDKNLLAMILLGYIVHIHRQQITTFCRRKFPSWFNETDAAWAKSKREDKKSYQLVAFPLFINRYVVDSI